MIFVSPQACPGGCCCTCGWCVVSLLSTILVFFFFCHRVPQYLGRIWVHDGPARRSQRTHEGQVAQLRGQVRFSVFAVRTTRNVRVGAPGGRIFRGCLSLLQPVLFRVCLFVSNQPIFGPLPACAYTCTFMCVGETTRLLHESFAESAGSPHVADDGV